jgi:hypothetical protein
VLVFHPSLGVLLCSGHQLICAGFVLWPATLLPAVCVLAVEAVGMSAAAVAVAVA